VPQLSPALKQFEEEARGQRSNPVEPAPAERQGKRVSLKPRVDTRKFSLNIPIPLHEELLEFSKDTDLDMSEVLIEGAKREMVRLRKLHGL
jgi:hypothetical protein